VESKDLRATYPTHAVRTLSTTVSPGAENSIRSRKENRVVGPGGRKASNSTDKISIVGVLRLRAIKPLFCERSAKRFAQDDGFVAELEIQLVGYAGKKVKKVTGSQDDDLVWVLKTS
jgi:hypothetical protein